VLGASWVLDASPVAVVAEDVAGNVGVSGCDVVMDRSGSGCDRRGWGLGWRGVGWSDSWWRHSRGAGGGFEAGGQVVVVVVDVVGVVDETDGTVARDDVAGDGGDDGLVGVVWVLASTQTAVSQVVGSVCPRFVSHISRSSVLPFSSPSLSPLL
jgi:hypothetical protein